jgi:pimeloyl-ACP methyl ester carboxylesterase
MSRYFSDQSLLNPPLQRAAYSDRTAWIMAECSALAYVENQSELRKALVAGDFKLIKGFTKDEITAYLAVTQKHGYAVLAFKGTVLTENNTIRTDLNFWWYKSHGVVFHEGFYQAYKSLFDEIHLSLKKLSLPLYVTGHSLGGALATVCVMNYPDTDKMASCYTFGAPRVCDLKGVIQFYKVPIYRLAHSDDVVPTLPFFAIGFTQIGDFRYIDDQFEVIEGSAGVFSRLWFQFKCLLTLSFARLVGDHAIGKYADILEKIAARRRNDHIQEALRGIKREAKDLPPSPFVVRMGRGQDAKKSSFLNDNKDKKQFLKTPKR